MRQAHHGREPEVRSQVDLLPGQRGRFRVARPGGEREGHEPRVTAGVEEPRDLVLAEEPRAALTLRRTGHLGQPVNHAEPVLHPEGAPHEPQLVADGPPPHFPGALVLVARAARQ